MPLLLRNLGHLSLDCERLHSSFETYQVPQDIQGRGPDKVIKFRGWYARNSELLVQNTDGFYIRMIAAFGLPANTRLVPMTSKNSGVQVQNNMSLDELESIIDGLLNDASQFFMRSTTTVQKIIRKYERKTHLVYSRKKIEDNDTGLTDEQLKEFLKDYAERFKAPVIEYLNEYYKVYFNHNLEFKGPLLDMLGFKVCGLCSGMSNGS